jgi:nicotinate-nucleotide adenylyltransferase
MVQRAIAGLAGFRADDCELRRGGPSYTVDTLEALRAELGSSPLCLLIGLDQFTHFEKWRRWQDIPGLAHLVVLRRPGVPPGPLPAWAQGRMSDDLVALRRAPAGRLAFLGVRPQDISATAIRARLARGESVAGLVPEAVLEYILINRLYGHGDRGA